MFSLLLSLACPMYWIFTVVHWFFAGMMRKETLHPPMFFLTTDVSLLCSGVPVLDLPCSFCSHAGPPVFFHTSSTACIESLAEQEVQPSIRWFYSFTPPACPHHSLAILCILTGVLSSKVNKGAILKNKVNVNCKSKECTICVTTTHTAVMVVCQ